MLQRASSLGLPVDPEEVDALPVQVVRDAEQYDFANWLPLALADLVSLLCARQPPREEILDKWGLHRMASAIRDNRTDSALEDFFGIGRGRA